MKLEFSVNYRTQWGEDVRVQIQTTNTKGQQRELLFSLDTSDGEKWQGETTLNGRELTAFTYRYCIYKGDEVIRMEWNMQPRRFRADDTKTFIFPDSWKDVPLQSHLFSSAFTRCIAPRDIRPMFQPYFSNTVVLRVSAPQLKKGQTLAILGNQPALGNWAPNMALRMHESGLYEWEISLNTIGLRFPFEYKYVVLDEKNGALLSWEEGTNRCSGFRGVDKNTVLVITDDELRLDGERWKAAGVVIPLFSLRSQTGCGVGDFGDLHTLVDWAVQTGMKVIQLLPIYDTTIHRNWHDSYPYNSISIYALHPQYTDMRQLTKLRDKKLAADFEAERMRLNALPQEDYEAVNKLKSRWLKAVFEQEGEAVLASADYKDFFDNNQEWLRPYAVFSCLRDCFGTADFRNWPECSIYNSDDVVRLCQPGRKHYQAIAYYFFVQYVLHRQMSRTSQYARQRGVVLKGDIPIGISRNSVEAWIEPYYFNLNGQAGAPPDDFSKNGQNWGFPTYNWDVMFKDGCKWWKQRFIKMSEYFDAYRIDHVLGFFRIWEIPLHSVHGLLGQFVPALPLSIGEIERYGLRFRKEYFTRPYITDWVLEQVFEKEQVQKVKDTYLNTIGYDCYEMKPEYDTQRKVELAFVGRWDEASAALREGLYSLISNVLFVPDRTRPDHYHPRIAVQNDYIYRTLSGKEREAFDALYYDYFYRRHNEFWYGEAMRRLPMLIEATTMLVCAEDLGMVPDCVPWVMNDLRILTLEIQTMPKRMGIRFASLEENPYRSVSTIFTHDMPTLRGWWEEDGKRAQEYYNRVLQKDGDAPRDMPAWLCKEVVARHLFSPSMLCLISWQDWMSVDQDLRYSDVQEERINVPANPHNYWRYRMHFTLEELMKFESFNREIRLMIEHSGRC
ncbi:MAG: 4-alpha-glucanotransferase [Clostridium sp.]|nr:4-alpha-glucanotransferase [Clostridium sp.]